MSDTISIDVHCPICHESDCINLTLEQYRNYLRWQNREILIQNALPELSKHQREQLKTGICAKCWVDIFGKLEEDEDDD